MTPVANSDISKQFPINVVDIGYKLRSECNVASSIVSLNLEYYILK